ncbi:dehydrogenase [Planctomycetota bacterium]|nr:dehydrogenase [Planctomycetota bacterium]
MTDHAISIDPQNRVALIERPRPPEPLSAQEIIGDTVVSLVSPGTELAMAAKASAQPRGTGYAAVCRITAVGQAVTELRPGDLVFAAGPHQSWQRKSQESVVPVPIGLDPAVAVFTRLLGVSWATLVTTTARPPDPVLVCGLGPVGNLAAQLFAAAGYQVIAVDPDPQRRDLAGSLGIVAHDRIPAIPGDGFQLAIDCSGHERAVLAACQAVRKRGEVVLTGVPWEAKAPDLAAFSVLEAVFKRYLVLRSGWEWEVPSERREFTIGNHLANYAAGMRWLGDGRINVAGLASRHAPADCGQVYADLAARRSPAPTALFAWSG